MPHSPLHQSKEQRDAAFRDAGVQQPATAPLPSVDPNIPLTTEIVAPSPNLQVTDVEISPVPTVPPVEAIPETPEATVDTSITELESEIQDFGTFDRDAQVTSRTEGVQKRLIEINKQISLANARSIEESEAARKLGEDKFFASAEVQKSRRTSAIEGLKLSAEKAAITGELTLARQLAGDAVDAEHAIEENQLKAKRANLIANYDSFTKEEQKRADALLLQIDGDLNSIKEQKDNQKSIEEEVNIAASFNGTQDQLADIRNSETKAEAIRKRTEMGLVAQPSELDTLKLEKARLDILKSQKDLAGGGAITFTDSTGNTVSLTGEQADDALEVGSKVTSDPVYKDMTDIQRGLLGTFTGLAQGNGFGDVAAINSFQRMIDPGATVRAEDVVLLQTASAILAKIDPKFITGKVTEGDKLPEQVREQMRNVAQDLYDSSIQSYQNLSGNRFNAIGAAKGLTPGMIGTNFASSDELISAKSLTPEEKTQALDKMVSGEESETIESSPVGFFEGFLNVFGLKKK